MTQLISKPIEDKILFSQKLLREVTERFKGKQVIVTIEEFNPRKVDQKRRVYFASIVEPMRQSLGYESKDEMHSALKITCNPKTGINLQTGEEKEFGDSTKKFTLQQWDEYISKCRALAKRLNIRLMTPDEYYESISNPEDQTEPIGE
jgi:hypothetical protein